MPDSDKQESANDDGLARDIKTYIENRIELVVITVTQQLSTIIAESIQKVIALLMIFIGMLILWMSLGFFLGAILQSYGLGFLIAALPLLLTGMLFYTIRIRKVEDQILAKILNKMPFDFNDDETSESDKTIKKG